MHELKQRGEWGRQEATGGVALWVTVKGELLQGSQWPGQC